MTHLSLKELAGIIKSTISVLSQDYWVVAEITTVRCNPMSGHCYLELVEKADDKTLAQIKANIWAGVYKKIISDFKKATGSELQAGMKILMRAKVTYHEVYGLSLNIGDIDPQYTLGEMALRRKQILDQLTKEGLIDRNRALSIPLVPQRIAIISSETAAGYGDFMHRMTDNPWGYGFRLTLFPAYMQGERAEQSILAALRQCRTEADNYDLVVIIRGGGSQVDLHCFDSYALGKEIALYPIPVLSGIGHERDETVVDRTAYKRLITPTAVADYLISLARDFEDWIDSLRDRLITRTNNIISNERHSVAVNTKSLGTATKSYLAGLRHSLSERMVVFNHQVRHTVTLYKSALSGIQKDILTGSGNYFKNEYISVGGIAARTSTGVRLLLKNEGHTLDKVETKTKLLDPINVLNRGYSLTLFDGKSIHDVSILSKGDKLETKFARGTAFSIVEDIKEEG